MTQQEISTILEKQRVYFSKGITLDVNHRIASLKLLHDAIKKNEEKIATAIKSLEKVPRKAICVKRDLCLPK